MKLFRFPQDEKEITRVTERAELASLLVPFVTESDIRTTCEQAVKYGMAGVLAVPDICVKTVKHLEGTGTVPICVVSANEIVDTCPEIRKKLVQTLIEQGVRDVDMGASVGMVLDEEFSEIQKEIGEIAELLHGCGGRLGVVLEINQIPEASVFGLCEAAIGGKADYLRISSGMDFMGAIDVGRATIHNVAVLYERYGDKIKIKAGGGWDLAWLEDCFEYLESGADRVDAGPCMLKQLEKLGYTRR